MKNQDSTYNVMVAWENGEVTAKKLLCAKDINLLDLLPGWKKHIIKFIAMPQKKVTHLVNKAKPWPYNRAHHYKYGLDIPYKYKLKGFYNILQDKSGLGSHSTSVGQQGMTSML